MDQNIPDTVAGAKTATLALAFLGSVLSLSYAKELTKPQTVVAVVTGTAAAVCASTVLAAYKIIPAPAEAGVAFFIGLAAMRLIPVIIDTAVENIKKAKLPWTKE